MFLDLSKLLGKKVDSRQISLPTAQTEDTLFQVTADPTRCVQCGVCSYNCPVGIDVREYGRRGQHVTDNRCITCGTCIEKCPRGTLRWGPAILVRDDSTLEIDPVALPAALQLQPRFTE